LSAFDLLQEAARGHLGVDRPLIQAILDSGDSAPAEALRFAQSQRDDHRLDLDPLLVDLLRYFRSVRPAVSGQSAIASVFDRDALTFFIEIIRKAPNEVDDELVEALLPYGDQAVGPLLGLYEELGEESGGDIAFLLAGLRVRDPRVLAILLDRLEFDAADGAFCLGLYGDPASRPALEKMLTEIPAVETELRREIALALQQLDTAETRYEPEPFDILAEYPKLELPPFDLLPEGERLEMLSSPDPAIRAGAAHSFFNAELSPQSRTALIDLAKSDPDPSVRGRAWASLAGVTEDAAVRDAMIAALNDESKPVEERGGAAVGLYAVADRDDVRPGIEALYTLGGSARIKAMEAMWRSLWEPYSKYFARHLEEKDPKLVREALRGAGYFRLTGHADKIASYFDRDEPYDHLREEALFAYALAMPGETTRGRVRGMLRKIDALAGLTEAEEELVMFGLDERLRLHGLEPVFEKAPKGNEDAGNEDAGSEGAEYGAPEPVLPPAPVAKPGRNDPCPCGSGKKYKKCCGASS